MTAERVFKDFFALAGITVNGDKPWDMQVKDDHLYQRVLAQGSLGLGEAYMDGWWECDDLVVFFEKVLRADLDKKGLGVKGMLWHGAKAKFTNLQSKKRAFQVGETHYDLGNDLFQRMLDKRMVYTCAYWKNVDNLEDAQEAKLDLVCRKIGLKPGDRVLDIGCGWGSWAKYAAEKYGAHVVGVTVSKEQIALGQEMCKGLPVEFRLQDYRDVDEQFDHIVSIGMAEQVGQKNFRAFFELCKKCLKDDGLFLLHLIGKYQVDNAPDPWVHKYIFPNGNSLTPAQISEAMENVFYLEDWHVFATYYYPTLLAWFENFDKAWPDLKEKYGERFYRMWKYYLLSAAGFAKSQRGTVWQLVLSKDGFPGGYESVR